MNETILGVLAFLFIQSLIPVCLSQSPDTEDIYTFCGKGKARGDNSACLGYCSSADTICSAETGICSCASPVKQLSNLGNNYNCKNVKPRTRCHNACKTFSMISPKFRRGPIKICESKTEISKRMCFCLPK